MFGKSDWAATGVMSLGDCRSGFSLWIEFHDCSWRAYANFRGGEPFLLDEGTEESSAAAWEKANRMMPNIHGCDPYTSDAGLLAWARWFAHTM